MRFSVFGVILFFVMASQAREVVLTSNGDPLAIYNPGGQAVNFDIACFQTSGAAGYTDSGLSIPVNGHWAPGASCANGYAVHRTIDLSSGGVTGTAVYCKDSSPMDYASSSVTCASGYSVATIHQLNNANIYDAYKFWFSPGTTNWYETNPYSGNITTSTISDGDATYAPIIGNHSEGCKDSNNDYVYNRCKKMAVGISSGYGAICFTPAVFSSTANMGFCKVTIHTTASDAYLTSNWFKGGTPF